MSTVLRLDEDVAEQVRRRAAAAEVSPSELLRTALDASTAGSLGADPAAAELGRVPFTLSIRAESLDWLAAVAARCGWPVDVAARHVFSHGRRAVDLQLARKAAGRQATMPLASAASWPAPVEQDDLDGLDRGPSDAV